MKKKDIIYMVLAAAIFLVAGYIIYGQLSPKATGAGANAGVDVEVVGEINPGFDPASIAQLTDLTKVKDYSIPFDLTTGLNNTAPFGK